MSLPLDADVCFAAIRAKDERFDGHFFTAVKSTGIYCRPICPARTPLRKNVTFFPSAAAAESEGYRACLRCRPDRVPGHGEWERGAAVVARALTLIDEEACIGIDEIARRVGVGERHLSRLFGEELGASPIEVAQTKRSHFARKLIEETSIPMTSVAFAAGYSSVRRFNASMRSRFGQSPTELRGGSRPVSESLVLTLPYKQPFHFVAMLDFLRPRAIAGVEQVDASSYRRWMRGTDGAIRVSVHDDLARSRLLLEISGCAPIEIPSIVAGVRRMFDLRADPARIEDLLAESPWLRPLLSRHPGTRVPGGVDGFELAVRAILGQQVSVAGASTLAARLASTYGEPIAGSDGAAVLFPRPEDLAEASLETVGLPNSRVSAIRGLARAVASSELKLDDRVDPTEGRERLCDLPGIGPWTAEYVAMRVFRDPDAFPGSDLGLRKGLAVDGVLPTVREVAQIAENWRPFRAYAAMLIWRSLSSPGV